MHPHDFEDGTLTAGMEVRAYGVAAELFEALLRADYEPSMRIDMDGPGKKMRATVAFENFVPGFRRSIWIDDDGWLIPELHPDDESEIFTGPKTRSAVEALAAVESLVAAHAGA